MRKKMILPAAVAACILAVPTGVMAAEEVPVGGVEVTESADSATGYTVSFTYYDEAATNVQTMGSFEFYQKNDERVYGIGYNLEEGDDYTNYHIMPEDWNKDDDLCHVRDNGYVADMEFDEETGAWTYTLDLTGGYYLYQYNVSTDNGESYTSVIDPGNIPYCNSIGANQTRSQFYVPYDAEKQSANDDWTWILPAENEEDRGKLIGAYYDGVNGLGNAVEIYLPAHYDKDREEPYNVLYLSHGAGGDEADWFYQGHAGNVVDRLAAAGECEEFIMVAMNNTVYRWDFDVIIDNVKHYLIPYMEENYNVSTEASGRGFCGLSMGAMTTNKMLFDDPEYFGYYGLFSGSRVCDWPELDDYSNYKIPNIYVAAGFEDHALSNKGLSFAYHGDADKTAMGVAEKMEELGISFNNGTNEIVVVQGAHDWYTWPQIIRDYASTTLWK